MDGQDDHGVSDLPQDGTDASPAPQYARMSGRTRPPAKAFVSKPFAGNALKRFHGPSVSKGPLVKWTQAKPGNNPSGASSKIHTSSNAAPRPTSPHPGGNMSERFIAERLLSDRGTGNSFNPQIPRRVPDIPNMNTVKAGEADAEGKRLLVGRAVQLSGEIGGCERLVVEGSVDVTLKDVKTLEVGAQGVFKGTAAVDAAVIAGSFEGTLKVSGHLDVGPGATVKGNVSYGTISVASGGKLMGTMESSDNTAA